MSTPSALFQRLRNYCNLQRDVGASSGDYVEQLTFPLFLKTADEQVKPPFNKPCGVTKAHDWQRLPRRSLGQALSSQSCYAWVH
jgi:hypothetical protein